MRTIHWFRQDLRLSDNPALYEAAKSGTVLPIYILTENDLKKIGSVSQWWLYNSLTSLKNSLNGKLLVVKGNPKDVLLKLVQQHKIDFIYWNRCYEPYNLEYDRELCNVFLNCKVFNGKLLWEPGSILKSDGSPYSVFTPFYRKGCLQNGDTPRRPLPKPEQLKIIELQYYQDIHSLLPRHNWYKKLHNHWLIGEDAAIQHLNDFLKYKLSNYKLGRDFLSANSVSRLSPYLHFGEISPNQVWYNVINSENILEHNLDCFLSELGWREFSYNLLYHFPQLQIENLNKKFNNFPWSDNDNLIQRWQGGKTGFPIIDAGMCELWTTGYMHNRVRMIVASFLIKNLLINWRVGEAWFWDCLVDADMANNAASWQWVAGCGADAAPYFRIFNPITQAKKFDPEGSYIRKYLPRIAHLSNEHLFAPWTYADQIHYPRPMIDLDASRKRALQAFQSINNKYLKDPS